MDSPERGSGQRRFRAALAQCVRVRGHAGRLQHGQAGSPRFSGAARGVASGSKAWECHQDAAHRPTGVRTNTRASAPAPPRARRRPGSHFSGTQASAGPLVTGWRILKAGAAHPQPSTGGRQPGRGRPEAPLSITRARLPSRSGPVCSKSVSAKLPPRSSGTFRLHLQASAEMCGRDRGSQQSHPTPGPGCRPGPHGPWR